MRRNASIVVAAALAVIIGCRGDSITMGETTASTPQGLTVSSPMSLASSTGVTASQDSLAFVSLVPGTAPDGVSASIRNSREGVAKTVTVTEGGFDPVGIAARVGDTIDVAVANAAGVVVFQADASVRAPRRPVVVRTNPPAKKTDVPLNIIIQVVFSAPIDPTTLASSVQLLRGTTPVPGTVGFTDSTNIIAEFHPDDLLAAATSYHLVVSQSIQDLNHVALESSVDVPFTTGTSWAASLVFTVAPTNTTAGVAITPAVAVAIQDGSGKTITYANGPVTIALTSGGSAALWGTKTVNAVNGVATFEDLAITRAATYSLVASYQVSSPSLTSAPSAAFIVLPAAASRLQLLGPSLVDATKDFTVDARISDVFDNGISSATDAVTLSLDSNPGGATLAGTLTVSALSGVATFANLSLDRPGLGYVVQATSGALRGSMRIDVWNRDAFTTVSAGNAHTCALMRERELYCWGANASGQVGVGNTFDYANPVHVAAGVFTVSTGGSHTCGIIETRLYCWGLNDDGQLADGTRITHHTPTATGVGPWGVGSVITGGSHTCAYLESSPWDFDDETGCWGSNAEGQLGGPNGNPPAYVIAAGDAHTCGIVWGVSTALYCWGSNKNGQLGAGTVGQFSPVPFRVGSFFENVAVSAGRSHTCANLTVGGSSGLFCWGLNDDGQVGDGTTIQRSSPALVSGGGGPFTSVTGGGSHTCALTAAGAAYCWGRNDHGQLGDGTTTMRTSPVLVAGGLTFVSLSAGGSHTCGVTVGGTYCWGANGSGQLGNGATTDSAVPVKVFRQ